MQDPKSAPLSAGDKALVAYAEKLTRSPGDMGTTDIEELREQGFSDREIHDATQVIALFNYYNRVADGLGVSLDDDEDPEPQQ